MKFKVEEILLEADRTGSSRLVPVQRSANFLELPLSVDEQKNVCLNQYSSQFDTFVAENVKVLGLLEVSHDDCVPGRLLTKFMCGRFLLM